MFIKRIQILNYNITFVIKHRWEKDKRDRFYNKNNYELGLQFKISTIVGNKGFTDLKNIHHVKSYMFIVNLIIFSTWITFNKNGLQIKIDENR